MVTDTLHPDDRVLPAGAAERLLSRAAELDAARSAGVSITHLRRVAEEAGLAPAAFEAALAADPSVAPAEAAPLWIRACLAGVPNRRAAMAFFWLFLLGLCATPVAALTGFWARPVAVAWALFLAFALWSTGVAVRWLDRHGWAVLR